MLQGLVFVAASIPIVVLSWPSLRDPHSHGFYRFFAFEAILALGVLNAPRWIDNPLSARQIASWLLLTLSLILAVHGFYLLRRIGQPDGPLENTTILVRRGAYRLIRHPLYASLLLLAWGALLKDISVSAGTLALIASVALFLTARTEEAEMLVRFGDAYAAYVRSTRMFIPYIF